MMDSAEPPYEPDNLDQQQYSQWLASQPRQRLRELARNAAALMRSREGGESTATQGIHSSVPEPGNPQQASADNLQAAQPSASPAPTGQRRVINLGDIDPHGEMMAEFGL
jgi:hypothetical protein